MFIRKSALPQLLLFLSSFAAPVWGQVRQTTEVIKTYPFFDPDPIPSLAVNDRISRFYPYHMFDGYSEKDSAQRWKVIELENAFIRVRILPEVGGKVWGAVEKSTGKEFCLP